MRNSIQRMLHGGIWPTNKSNANAETGKNIRQRTLHQYLHPLPSAVKARFHPLTTCRPSSRLAPVRFRLQRRAAARTSACAAGIFPATDFTSSRAQERSSRQSCECPPFNCSFRLSLTPPSLLSSRRYATDAIHNTIARARSPLERGGYSRVSHTPSGRKIAFDVHLFLHFQQICHLAEDSISKVLDENDNASHLLDLHRAAMLERDLQTNDINSPSRPIKIQ